VVSEQGPDDIGLPGYRDFEPVARSDGSIVYRAKQDGVDRPVAVKVLRLADPAAVARFQREVEITVRLGRQHPHIVTVIETGTTARGEPCIVMEYYDLGSLHDLLRRHGPLAATEVVAAGTVVADALSFAHRHGVLHRDVKPQNILVLPTSYVIADFGIARRIDAAHTASVEWFSFRHAAPQVMDGEPPSVTDDIWSLGSSLFTVLDGRPPFAEDDDSDDSDTALAYMHRVRTGRPRPLLRTDLPPGLAAIIGTCLQRERADRFPDAATLHDALRALAAQELAWAPASAEGAPPPVPRAAPPGPPPFAETRIAPPARTATPAPAPVPRAPTAPPGPPSASPPSAPPPSAPPPSAPPFAPPFAPPAPFAPSAAPIGAPLGASPEAHVVAPPFFATDFVPADSPTGPYPTEEPPPAPDPPVRKSRSRRFVVALLITVVLGSVGGVAGTWIAQLARADTNGSAGSRTPSDPALSPVENLNNAAIAPELTQVSVQGTSVTLRWRDKSGGQARFVVVQVVDNQGKTVSAVLEPTTTETVVNGLEPPYCFMIYATVGSERGVSRKVCAGD
jgi:serine/threonine protein kinase